MPRTQRRILTISVVAVAAAALALAIWHQGQRYPKRFAAVVPGHLYRSGGVSPAQLAALHTDYGIDRVICLLNPADADTQAEHAAAEQLGLVWENLNLRGDGSSTPADRVRLRALLSDPNAPPTLVHCAAGTNRTGLAIGLYRIYQQGWTYDQVLTEMRRFGFEDLPKHENLRQALQEAAADAERTAVATTQPVAATQ